MTEKKIDVILVHTGNFFPEYILDCIENLKKYSFKIHLIISEKFFGKIEDDEVEICSEESLLNDFYFSFDSKLDKFFRDGFWVRTTSRFFLINNYVENKKIENFFHIENDVLVFDNFEKTKKLIDLNDRHFCCLVDSPQRCISSVVYFKGQSVTKKLCDYIIRNNHKDDMTNLFGFFYENREISTNLPIIPIQYDLTDFEVKFSNYFNELQSIFDAAAIGQYLGGVDPRNMQVNSKGFVNEQSFINPSKFQYTWINNEPYLVFNKDRMCKINNLHVHSKNLKEFMKKNII